MPSTQSFLDNIKKKAQENPQTIVFPEASLDDRIFQAVQIIAKKHYAKPLLLGNTKKLEEDMRTSYDKSIPDSITFIDPTKSPKLKEKLAQELVKIRQHKGLSLDEAHHLLEDINYFGTMLVQQGYAQGMISGTTFPTNATIRPALQILKLKDKFHRASSFFFMILQDKIYLFADCAVNIMPSSEDLKHIALDTIHTAQQFGLKPKISFLSFSTKGSAKHPSLDRIIEATKLTQKARPDLLIEGEVQVDTAISYAVAAKKYPTSQIKGDSNILIFPDLNSANISYKLVERLAKAQAIGPIMQGLSKPINDLSRGCGVEDIVNLSAITTIQAQDLNFATT